jgi:hypothetical protein
MGESSGQASVGIKKEHTPAHPLKEPRKREAREPLPGQSHQKRRGFTTEDTKNTKDEERD